MLTLFFIFCGIMLVIGILSAAGKRHKVKDVSFEPEKTSESPEDIALYNEDREAYYRKLNVFTESEIQELMEEKHADDLEYEKMREEMYGKD